MKNSYKYFKNPLIKIHTIAFLVFVITFLYLLKLDFTLELFFFCFIGTQLFSFVFVSLPMIILHQNYSSFNRNRGLIIDLPKRSLYVYENKTHIKSIDFDDIEKLYKVFSYNRSFIHFGYMDYFYFELILKNGESEIITCLINDDLDIYIEKEKIKLISKFFPLIKYSEHYFED